MENERIKALEEELRSLENRKYEIKQQICEEKACSSANKIIGRYFLQRTNDPDTCYIIRPTAINPYDINLGTMVSTESMCINTSPSPHVSYMAESMPLMSLIITSQEITEKVYHDYKLKAINIILKTAQDKDK